MPNKKNPLTEKQQRAKRKVNMLNANKSKTIYRALRHNQKETCPVCKKKLTTYRPSLNIHHIDYLWSCEYTDENQYPPCKRCKTERPEAYTQCTNGTRMILVHRACHEKLHHIITTKPTEKDIQQAAQALYPILKEIADSTTSVEDFITECKNRGLTIRRPTSDSIAFKPITPTGYKVSHYVTTDCKVLKEFAPSKLRKQYR